jgi:hypothetical protein
LARCVGAAARRELRGCNCAAAIARRNLRCAIYAAHSCTARNYAARLNSNLITFAFLLVFVFARRAA